MPQRPIHGLKRDIPDIRDLRYSRDYLKIGRFGQLLRSFVLPKSVDLRSKPMPPVVDQGTLGSCTANAAQAVIGHVEADEGDGVLVGSRLFLYGNSRGWDPVDSGAYLRDVMKALAKYGICEEALWPYDLTRWKDKPPVEVFDAAASRAGVAYYRINTVESMKMCLAVDGNPFVFGVAVYDTFGKLGPGHVVPVPTRQDRLEGGHAICAVGYDNDKGLLFRNSWGKDWGDGGHAWLPWRYVENDGLFFDAWAIRSIPN